MGRRRVEKVKHKAELLTLEESEGKDRIKRNYKANTYWTERAFEEDPKALKAFIDGIKNKYEADRDSRRLLGLEENAYLDLDDGLKYVIKDGKLMYLEFGYCREKAKHLFTPCEVMRMFAIDGAYAPETLEDIYAPFCKELRSNAINGLNLSIKHIRMPELRKLREYAIQYCNEVEELKFPKIKRLEKAAILNCYGLRKIELDECEYIDDAAIIECHSLREVVAPKLRNKPDCLWWKWV